MTVVDSFIEWAHGGLLQSEEAQSYLLGRGVSKEQWSRYGIGYVLGDFHPNLFVDPKHSDACSDKKAVHRWCDSCRFVRWSSIWNETEDGWVQHVGRRIQKCIVMPLTSYSGNFVGFQVRSIVDKQFDSFSLLRRPEGHFFGVAPCMDTIWSTRRVFVTEGPFDHLVFERLISPNVVGLTTNVPNAIQTRFFRRFVDWVGLFLDADKAGRDGASIFKDKLSDGPFVHDFKIDVRGRNGRCKDLNEAWKVLGDRQFADRISEIVKRHT